MLQYTMWRAEEVVIQFSFIVRLAHDEQTHVSLEDWVTLFHYLFFEFEYIR